MKILHTAESYAPEVCGVQQAVQRISEGLAERGHQVTVVTALHAQRDFQLLNHVEVKQFNVSGKWMLGFKGDMQGYKRFIASHDCDVMMNYAAQSWTTDLIFPLLEDLSCIRILLPCGYSSLNNWKWRPYFWYLPHVLRKYDHIIYLSENYQDKEFGDQHDIKNFSIIGNGTDKKDFEKPLPGFKDLYGIETKHLFLCVSNYAESKNQAMVLEAYCKAQIKDSTLVFIGSEINEYAENLRKRAVDCNLEGKRMNIMVLEKLPRETTLSAFHEADLFLFGSKIECFPIVILEAMAAKTPFISTDCGNAKSLEGGVIVSTTDEMAQVISRLSCKGSEWQKLVDEGHRMWKISYQWDNIVDQYEQLYFHLCKDRALTTSKV